MEATAKRVPSFRIHSAALAILSCVFTLSRPAKAAGPITEFPIPTADAGPLGIAAGPDGNVWFCEYNRNMIGRITPEGVLSEFPTQTPPIAITAGSDGNLWYAAADLDSTNAAIGRMSPAGEATEFPAPLSVCGIAAGSDGNLWFPVCNVANEIGRITPTGTITTFSLPTTPGQLGQYPTAITSGPDGALWFPEPGRGNVGRISTSGSISEFPLAGVPSSIVSGPDGNLWVAEGDKIGRITPGGQASLFPIAASALTVGPDGKLWFADAQGNRVGRLSVDSGTAFADAVFSIPTSGASAAGISAGPDGNVWFTEGDANAIGRVDLSAVCDPGTLCLGGRFQIGVSWAGSGSSGTGTPLSLTANAGAFWFFDASNLEVFVKVLDACATSGAFTVYVNGLTHLGVTVTVKDRRTGTSRTFAHPDGTDFSLLFDGSTFACP